MPIFPFYPNYYNYYYYNKKRQNELNKKDIKPIILEKNNSSQDPYDKTSKKDKKRTSNFANFNISALLENDINTPILEIFGIKLYLDDLIIIGLLFFLYKEEVQYEILFGILLLLLLS